MTDFERRREEIDDKLEHLSHLLRDHGMKTLAYSHRRWRCTFGHDLQDYYYLRAGRSCPVDSCAGIVEHFPLSWFDVPRVVWTVAHQKRWTVALTMYEGGDWYQWQIGPIITRAENEGDAALDALIKALEDDPTDPPNPERRPR